MTGFRPPPYPYDRLRGLAEIAASHPGGAVDLSVGTPCDPPAEDVLAALEHSGAERGYPPSVGTVELREAAAGWYLRRFGVEMDLSQVAACVGTKELVVGLPHWLRLRSPERDTVLYPAVSYPSYAMGATLGGCRAVPVPMDPQWRLELSAIDPADAGRALCLWSNTPGNPAGGLDDLGAVARWGVEHGVPVFSDECYADFTWVGDPPVDGGLPGHSILEWGTEGVVAVSSLSKRSNLAGLRVGFYSGDAELIDYLSEVRKHAGLMVPGPVQAAGVAALADGETVRLQRGRYRARLQAMAAALGSLGCPVGLPDGGFYLWVPAPGGDAWELADWMARELGVVGSPGEFYGPQGAPFLRLALVQPEERLELISQRAGDARPCPGAP